MKKIIIAVVTALLASVNLKITGDWQAGLTLAPSSKLFKILNEFIQPFTNINLIQYTCNFAIVLGLLKFLNVNKNNIISTVAKIFNLLYAVVLAIFLDYGVLFSENSVNTYIYSKLRLGVVGINIIGISMIFYLLIESIEIFLLTKSMTKNISINNYIFSFWKYFFFLFVCWLPYIIILYPGTINHDFINQLNEFFGHGSWVRDDYPIGWYLIRENPFSITNQHNFFVTLFYGFNFKVGLTVFHSVGAGMFINTLVQIILMISVLTYSLLTFYRLGMSKKILNFFADFMAFFPMLPVICVFLTKNNLYTPFILLSILLVANALNDKQLFKNKKWWLFFIVSMMGQLMTEKYAIYIVFVVGIIIMITQLKVRIARELSLTMIGSVITFVVIQSLLFNILKVPNGDPIEGQAVMIQSTALYVKEFPKDITKDRYNTINKAFAVKNLPKLYSPGISDPVKSSGGKKIGLEKNGTFNQHLNKQWVEGYKYRSVTKKEYDDYKKVWLKLALRHPEIVFIAFMNQSYRYLDIVSTQGTATSGWSAPYDSINVAQFPIELIINKKLTIINYTNYFVKTRAAIVTIYNILCKIPPFSLLLNGNIFIFVTILIFLVLIAAKMYEKSMLIFSFLLQVPIFMLSPVNGSQRYMYPFFFATIIMIGLAYCWLSLSKRKNRKVK